MARKTSRQVKLYGKRRPSVHSTWSYRKERDVPWLNVSGIWLEQAGFRIGDRVVIEVSNRQLIIKNMSGEED